MNYHIHLRDDNGKILATFHDVTIQIGKVSVILWKGDYYNYQDFKVQYDELILFFDVTNIMELPDV